MQNIKMGVGLAAPDSINIPCLISYHGKTDNGT